MNALDPQRPYVVTHARVLAIAVPMTLSNATTPLLGVVATAVIGRLGQAHLLGAVAMSSVVFDCMFWLFAFLRMGTVALTAQALGAGDVAEERATLMRALLVAAAIGLALIVLQAPLGAIIYRLMGASAEVTAAAQTYFFVRIWSAPFVMANFVLLGWFVGLARASTALALQVAINVDQSGRRRRCWCCGSTSALPARRSARWWRRRSAPWPVSSLALRIVGAHMPGVGAASSTASGSCACSSSTATSSSAPRC